MNSQLKFVSLIAVSLFVASPIFALGQEQRSGIGWVLEIYGVSEELDISENQKEALRDHSELFMDSLQKAIARLKTKLKVAARDLEDFQQSRPRTRDREEIKQFISELNAREKKLKSVQDQVKSEISSVVQKVLEEERKTLRRVLLDRQMKRLDQLHLQLLGLSAVLAPRVVKELKISDLQQKEIRETIKQYLPRINRQRKRFSSIERDDKAKLKEEKDKLNKLLERADRKVMEVLRSSQRSKFKNMIGKKFDFAVAAKPEKK